MPTLMSIIHSQTDITNYTQQTRTHHIKIDMSNTLVDQLEKQSVADTSKIEIDQYNFSSTPRRICLSLLLTVTSK